MLYKFTDKDGAFIVDDPLKYNLYFPLTDGQGRLFSAIAPNLSGDIKMDNSHFLTPPAGAIDLKNNLLCRRDFFIRTEKEIIRASYPYKDRLECGQLYHKLIKETKEIKLEILNFIPFDIPVEVMHVKLTNQSGKGIRIIPTSFIPLYGRSAENLRDHRHVSSLFNRVELDKNGIYLMPTMAFDEKGHKVNKTIYFCAGFQANRRPFIGQFPTIENFCGSGDLIFPDAVYKNIKSARNKRAEFDGKEACAAFRFASLTLKPSKSEDYFILTGISQDTKEIAGFLAGLNSPEKIFKSFEETKKYWKGYNQKLEFEFPDKNFNGWLLWVKLQPRLRQLFGCSFLPYFDYGKGGRGWRDLWQDALALLLTESSNNVRQLISRNFCGVRIDGSNATIINKNTEFNSDRNNISRVWMDHAIWPYLTTRYYLHKTGELDFLLEELPYFRDHLLKRAKEIDQNFQQKDFVLRSQNPSQVYKGSVLEHILVQHLTSFFNAGSHNMIRLENADWNDGLDMAEDEGESAAFSFMFAHNLFDMVSFLENLKQKTKEVLLLKELLLLIDTAGSPINYDLPAEKQARLKEYLEAAAQISGQKINVDIEALISDLRRKAEHLSLWLKDKEWLPAEGFFNGYYDNSQRRVEGRYESGMRMLLAASVFAIMSSVASDSQIKLIWQAIKKNLYDKKMKGFRLNTDFKSLYLELGRAFGFSYGDKENGAFFSHMNMMLAYSLYKRGFVREGLEVLASVYKMSQGKSAQIYPCLPEYFNSQGKGLYLYLTGSASWLIYTFIDEVLGLKFYLGDIIIAPKLLPENFFKASVIKFSLFVDAKRLRVIYTKETNKEGVYEIKDLFLDGVKVLPAERGFVIKRDALKDNSVIEATMH